MHRHSLAPIFSFLRRSLKTPRNISVPVVCSGPGCVSPRGPRCRGRNVDTGRCCTASQPCEVTRRRHNHWRHLLKTFIELRRVRETVTTAASAGAAWCVGTTTVSSSGLCSTPRMTAASSRRRRMSSLGQGRDVRGGMWTRASAAPPPGPVWRGRGTARLTRSAEVSLSAETTTANNLEMFSIQKMIAVSNQQKSSTT